MRIDDRRRFTIADGMILVASTALALVAARSKIVDPSMPRTTWAWAVPNLTWVGLAFTLALIPIRLGRPRPARDELWRQPGLLACVSVAIALLISILEQVVSISTFAMRRPNISLRGEFGPILEETIYRLPGQAILVIAASWTILALGGRWKAERGWIDRAGRVIGVYWIVINLVSWCSVFFV